MACAINAELLRQKKSLPVLVMPTVDRYLSCTDWFYLNALIKYLTWSSTEYVGLSTKVAGKPYLDFPDIQLVRGGGAFSLRMAGGTPEVLRTFLEVADYNLEEIELRADKMKLEFPVVVRDGELF
jgi:hypothetical protein